MWLGWSHPAVDCKLYLTCPLINTQNNQAASSHGSVSSYNHVKWPWLILLPEAQGYIVTFAHRSVPRCVLDVSACLCCTVNNITAFFVLSYSVCCLLKEFNRKCFDSSQIKYCFTAGSQHARWTLLK